MPFKRGDIVEYDTSGCPNMERWKHLNGRIGVVTQSGVLSRVLSQPATYVDWFTNLTEESERAERTPYDDRLLRLVGHIEMPEPSDAS